jgi:hypothetical protein
VQPGDFGTAAAFGVCDLEGVVTVSEAVGRELAELGAEESGLGATALVLAAELDSSEVPASARAMCARELRAVMDRIAGDSQPKTRGVLDELRARREQRLAGGAGA